MEKLTVFVVSAHYSDNSGYKVIAVYDDEECAKDAIALIEAAGPVMNPIITQVTMFSV